MKDKIFGILHLSSRLVTKDSKNNIYKKFTPYDSKIKPFNVKTKKTQLIDIYCIVSRELEIVLEYFDDLKIKDIPKILTMMNWKNLNKLNIEDIKNIDLTPNRIDLTHLTAYTIDPEGSLDRDDAIGIDKDNFKIFIHIADPSSYVENNSDLDLELRNRCESVYLNKTYHMFPELLATKYISLTENQDNRAFTLELQMCTKMKNIISHKFYKSLIRVKNLTYDKFESYINNDYTYCNSDYFILYDFTRLLVLDNNINYDAHIMVEKYMILCNSYVAEELKNIPSIVRYNKATMIKSINHSDNINPKLIEMYKLCTYDAATYELNQDYMGHSALKLDNYTHFTSPLRRYADLVVHRILWNKLENNNPIYTDDYIKNVCSELNMIKKIYKRAYNLYNVCKIMNNNKQLELETNIIYFDTNIIKLYSQEHKLIFNLTLIHKTIKKITNTNIDCNELQIELLTNNDTYVEIVNLKLFQNVKIKIYEFNSSNQPYKIDLIEPYIILI
jgi:exoribonuclease R